MNDARHPQSIVHVVDDDQAFLRSLSRLLRASGYAVSTFACADELLDEVDTVTRGCVIIDLKLRESSGLDVQASLTRIGCAMPTIFLTGNGDIPSTVHAIRHGAEDFLTKLAPKQQLLDAVDRALKRDASQRDRLAHVESIRARFALLTPREREVLEHVLRGMLNKQIAAALGIHERTVKLHRTSITTKLGVHSVAELSHLAHEMGVFESPATR